MMKLWKDELEDDHEDCAINGNNPETTVDEDSVTNNNSSTDQSRGSSVSTSAKGKSSSPVRNGVH